MKSMPRFVYDEPEEKPLSAFLLLIGKMLVRRKYKVKYIGLENIPKDGAFILAANHIHSYDPIMLSLATPRTIHFMAKSELFHLPIVARIMRRLNSFPIRRGTSDFTSLDFAEKIIENGWIMGIFPEGTRSRKLTPQKEKTGVAYLANRTKSSVLPVSIYQDPDEKAFRHRITVRFGEIIRYDEMPFVEEYSPKKSKEAAAMIMNRIVELWKRGHDE